MKIITITTSNGYVWRVPSTKILAIVNSKGQPFEGCELHLSTGLCIQCQETYSNIEGQLTHNLHVDK